MATSHELMGTDDLSPDQDLQDILSDSDDGRSPGILERDRVVVSLVRDITIAGDLSRLGNDYSVFRDKIGRTQVFLVKSITRDFMGCSMRGTVDPLAPPDSLTVQVPEVTRISSL